MPPPLVNPGFEDGEAPWSFLEGASRVFEGDTGIPAHGGEYAGSLMAFYQPPPFESSGGSQIRQLAIPAHSGVVVPVSLWVYRVQGTAQSDLVVRFDPAGAENWQTLVKIALGTLPIGSWIEVICGSFVAEASQVSISFESQHDWGPIPDIVSFLIDDLIVGFEISEMARLLSELPVRALLGVLQASLPAEITGIAAERADNKPLPAVESWYSFPRPDPSPDHCEVEVFEVPGGITFPQLERNFSQWTAGTGRGPLDTDVQMNVRLTFANREAGTASDIWNRARRYAAAIVRTIANNPELGQGSKVKLVRIGSPGITLMHVGEVREGVRVTVPVLARIQETHANELQAGGGVPPACILEQV